MASLLEGHSFNIYIDHKPITFDFQHHAVTIPPRRRKWPKSHQTVGCTTVRLEPCISARQNEDC